MMGPVSPRWLALCATVAVAIIATATMPGRPVRGETVAENDGGAAFDAALRDIAKAPTVAAVVAMFEAEELARTLPWRPQMALDAGVALGRLGKVLRDFAGLGKGRRTGAGARPWVAGEARLGLARLAAVLEPDSPTAANAHAKAAGCLDEGAVLGPLEGPVPGEPPAGGAAVVGKHGLTPFRVFRGGAGPDGLPLGDWLPSEGDAHAWVSFDLHVSAQTSATLVLGSNGPLSVWFNGDRIAAFDGERPAADWQHAVGLRLAAGHHRLKIGVGHAMLTPRLHVRLVDGNGLAVETIKVVAPAPDAATAAFTVVDVVPLPALARNANETAAFLIHCPRTPALDREAARLLSPDGAPPCATGPACWHLGRAELPADPSRARLAFEAAAAFGHAPSLAALVDLVEARGLTADADRFARRLAAIAPLHPAVSAHRALRLLEFADGQGVGAFLAGLPQVAVNARLAILHATALEHERSVPDAAAAWARVTRLQHHASDPLQRALGLYRRANRIEPARALVAAALAERPLAADVWLLRARLEIPEAEPDAIIANLMPVSDFHHQHPSFPTLLGRLSLLAGDTARAVEAFDRALELSPQDRDLADHRRTLVSERGIADQFFVARDELDRINRDTPAVREGAVYLTDRQRVRVFDNGLASTFRQYAIRIDNDRVAERHVEQVFPFTPGEDRIEILEAEIIRADGARLRPEAVTEHRSDGKEGGVYTLTAWRVVRFPALRKGDIVHIQTRKDEIGARNIFGDFFGSLAPLSAGIPKAEVEFVVDAPATRPLYHFQFQLPEPEVVTEGPGRNVLRWRVDDLPAIAVEPNMPGYGDVGAWVNVSTFASWDDMIAWYRQLVRPQLELTAELRAIAGRLADEALRELGPAADAAAVERAKVEAMLRWVLQSTRYVGIEFGIHGFKPYHVGEVVRRGYGDCKDKAGLLVAMLREVGVRAEFVLVRTRDFGRLAAKPATLWTFNHAIAYVPGLDIFLDGTAELSGLDELPELDQGAQMLRFDPWSATPPTVGIIPMQTAMANRVFSETLWQLAPDGNAIAKLTERLHGANAAKLRYMMQDPTRRVDQLSQILSSQHAGTEIVDASFDNLETIGRAVSIHVTARLPGLARRDGDTLTVPLVIAPGRRLRDLGALQSRKQPLVMPLLEHESSVDVWNLPEGAVIGPLPAPTRIDSSFGSYELKTTTDGGTLRVEMAFDPHVERVAPSAYGAFRGFLEAIARAEAAVFTVGVRAEIQ